MWRATSTRELKIAMEALPQEGLNLAARALLHALEGSGEQREDYWKNRIQPFLATNLASIGEVFPQTGSPNPWLVWLLQHAVDSLKRWMSFRTKLRGIKHPHSCY